MNRSLLLFLLACFGLPILTCSNVTAHKEYLKQEVITSYGNATRLQYRLNQVAAESNWNPRATSDFKGWKKKGLDTITAIKNGYGAAGLTQFIFATAKRYGADMINTAAACDTVYRTDIYNPFWSLRAMCRYMKSIDVFLLARTGPKVRSKLQTNRKFNEQCATASYNAGEGRILKLLKKYASWELIKYRLPRETIEYSEKIVKGMT